MFSSSWYCDVCGRSNNGNRYQCQQCCGFDTYDLCDRCIARAQFVHPNHSFRLVQRGRRTFPNWNSRWLPYNDSEL